MWEKTASKCILKLGLKFMTSFKEKKKEGFALNWFEEFA